MQENQSKIFHEIVQFSPKELQNGQGSGLGLYISKGIVDMHGGLMGLHSEGLGKGTTFFAQFPLLHREASISWIASGSTDSGSPASLVPRLSLDGIVSQEQSVCFIVFPLFYDVYVGLMDHNEPRMRLLIVDDAIACRKMVIRIIKDRGYKYVEAKNGKEAIEAVELSKNEGQKFDCILMDSSMPVLSGPDATTAIRGLGFKGKIFGITGNTLMSDVDDFVARGLDEIFLKPIRPTELLSVLLKMETPNDLFPSSLNDANVFDPLSNESIADDFKPRVLIVDDALPCRKMIIRMLQDQCHYSEASNGRLAVELVLASMNHGLPFHYILMDSSMPAMSGPEATQVIRTNGYKGKIYGVTGNVQKSDLDSFLACGLDGIMTKPLSPNDLFAALEISTE